MIRCSLHSLKSLPQEGQVKDFFPMDSSLVIRRGECFRLDILSSSFSGSYDIQIHFVSFYNPRQTYGHYTTNGDAHSARQIILEVKIPNTFPIGKFSLSVKLFVREARETKLGSVSPDLIVLFNPYLHEDVVHLADSQELHAYLREDCGVIFRGSREEPEEYPWEFAQYSEDCLGAAMKLASEMEPESAADVVKVCKHLTSQVNPFNQHGIFTESYSCRPVASTCPAQWNSSLPPLRRFLSGKLPPLPGECWALAGVLVSLLRCVGIPARPVTCYNAAHQCGKLGRNDRYYIHQQGLVDSMSKDCMWVYHVWVEAWVLSSPNSAPSWHALDPSSKHQVSGPHRTGPVPVASISNYRSLPGPDHSVECVAGEVNYSCYTYRVMGTSAVPNCWKYTLVRIEDHPDLARVVTLSPCNILHDLTERYKLDFKAATGVRSEDLSFEVVCDCRVVSLGNVFKFGILVKNVSDFAHRFEGFVSVDSILYNLLKLSHIKEFPFSGSLGPRKTKEFNFQLKYHEYSPHLLHQGFIRLLYEAEISDSAPEQIFLSSCYLRVQMPTLSIEVPQQVKLGSQYRIRVSFRNPLPTTLSHITIQLNGHWLMPDPQELKFRRSLKPDEECSVIAKLHPTCLGIHKLFATLTSNELSNVYTTRSVRVVRA